MLYILLATAGCGVRLGVSDDYVREFENIQNEFDSAGTLPAAERPAEFKRIAIMYQSLLDKGIRSGQLYYNQGNAWFYAGERGRAIVAYRLALRYLPSDSRIHANLRVAVGSNIDAGELGFSGGQITIFEYLFFWQNWVGVNIKVFCSTLLSIFLFVVGLSILFVRRKFQRFLKRFAIFLFVITLISVISTAYDWYRFECFSYAVISIEDAQPRKGNSLQYDKAFTRPVPLGTNSTVIGERGEWLHLRFGNTQDGWLPKSQVIVY
ncbi:MAG: tetratricopeptide repeat protein [Planctomycetaceae bacterium]|nr:tetratricopeptide repeat protein [Planctomycetaceae bacterium]